MIRFRLYYDKDAEQKWLNKMAAKGWALKKYCLAIYLFVPCEPGEYIYQIDLLGGWNGEKDRYQEFMRELKIETVARWTRWFYLRKKTTDGPFELYTDAESRISQYKRIRSFFIWASAAEIVLMGRMLISFCTGGIPSDLVIILLTELLATVFTGNVIKCSRKIASLRQAKPVRAIMPVMLAMGIAWIPINFGFLLLKQSGLVQRTGSVAYFINIVTLVLALILMLLYSVQQSVRIKN